MVWVGPALAPAKKRSDVVRVFSAGYFFFCEVGIEQSFAARLGLPCMFVCTVELRQVHIPSTVWAFCHFLRAIGAMQDFVANLIAEVQGRGRLNSAQQNSQQDSSPTNLNCEIS